MHWERAREKPIAGSCNFYHKEIFKLNWRISLFFQSICYNTQAYWHTFSPIRDRTRFCTLSLPKLSVTVLAFSLRTISQFENRERRRFSHVSSLARNLTLRVIKTLAISKRIRKQFTAGNILFNIICFVFFLFKSRTISSVNLKVLLSKGCKDLTKGLLAVLESAKQ